MHAYIQAMESLLIEQFIQDENIENYKPEAIHSLINSFTHKCARVHEIQIYTHVRTHTMNEIAFPL